MRLLSTRLGSLDFWLRELHIYLGLFISPFVLVFAISAILFNHTWKPWNAGSEAVGQKGRMLVEIPKNVEGLALARQIMRQVDVSGEVEFFSHHPSQKQMIIPVMKPGQRIEIRVDVESRMAEITQHDNSIWDKLLYLHKSPGPHLAGFRGNWFYTRLWGWLADATVYLILFLSVSGIYLWRLLRAERKIGWGLLGAGGFTFFLLVLVTAG